MDDFVNRHRPRHPVESLGIVGPEPQSLRGPRTLVDLYLEGDARPIFDDVLSRPDHYSDRHHDIARALFDGKGSELEEREVNDLFLQWQRPTEVAEATREALTRASSSVERKDPGDDEPPTPEPPKRSFEDGPGDDLIQII